MKKNTIYVMIMLTVALVLFGGCTSKDNFQENTSKIHEVVPDYAYHGDEVVLYGVNLPEAPVVKVNEVEAEVVSGNGEMIKFIVPETVSGTVAVESAAGTIFYDGFRIYEDVIINSFSPERITYDGELVIKGSGFDVFDMYANKVTIIQDNGETKPLKVLSATTDEIVVIVEESFRGPNKIRVKVGKNEALSAEKITFAADVRIDAFTPHRGGAGTEVTITGMNFRTEDISMNEVSVDGVALEVVEVIDRTTMKVRIPKNLDRFGNIKLSVPGEEHFTTSADKFRYDPAIDMDWGKKGLSFGGKNVQVPVTQGMVDSLLTMGVNFMTFRCDYTSEQGLVTGALSAEANMVLDNVIKIKQMSQNRIKVILSIGHAKGTLGSGAGAGYSSVTNAGIKAYFDNIKAYQYNGSTAWDCIDAFQVLYNTSEFVDPNSENGIKDYFENVLKPVYMHLHPEGYCRIGEKFVFTPQAILNGNNFMLKPDTIQPMGFLEYMDVFLMMWNLNNGSGNKYYSRSVPSNVFFQHWNNFGRKAICENPDYPVAFMAPEVNINAKNAPYQMVDELAVALQSIADEMSKEPNFKGFGYRAFLEDNSGIRRSDNKLDPRTDDNKVKPQISFFDMYKNLKIE